MSPPGRVHPLDAARGARIPAMMRTDLQWIMTPMALSPPFVERAYNNRALAPAYAAFFARWESDSAFVRETLPGKLDLAYGPDPRHRIDVFPAGPGSSRLLIVIHGGYWRSLDKSYSSWLAASWVAANVSVALLNYRLCPAVRIGDIVDDVVAGANWPFANTPPARAR